MTPLNQSLGLITAERGKVGYQHIDYDTHDKQAVVEDIQHLQRTFRLGNAALVRTTNGFHAIFFWNQLDWKTVLAVVDASTLADPDFKDAKRIQGFNRIRLSGGDLTLEEVVESPAHQPDELGDFHFMNYQRLI